MEFGLLVMFLICQLVDAAPVNQLVCIPLSGTAFDYECNHQEETLCIPGRHLRIPEADCSSGILDLDRFPLCVPCEHGTFMSGHNFCDACQPWKNCPLDEIENPDSPPSSTRDRDCIRRSQLGTSTPSSLNVTDEQLSTPAPPGDSSNKTRENTNPEAETGSALGLMLFGTAVLSFFLGGVVVFAIQKKCNPCGNNVQNATDQGGNALPNHDNSSNGPTGQRPTSLTSGDGPPSGHGESPRNQEEMPMLDGQPPVTAEPDGSTN